MQTLTRIIRTLIFHGFMLLAVSSWGQKDDAASTFPLDNFYAELKHRPRSLLKNVKFGFSTGYGNTFFSHNLEGFGIYQATGNPPSIFVASGPPTVRIGNWVNQGGTDTSPFQATAFTVNTNTSELGFKANALNIPFKLTLHYEFAKKYRIGGGYSYELMSIGTMNPISFTDQISSFQPTASTGWMSKYFGLIGVSFYRLGDYLFTGDAQIGGYNPGSNFNPGLVTTGIYFNLGVTVERELSEYLRLFVRPSYDIKSYSVTLPEGGPSINHNINAFYLNIGISYSIPELPKCFISDCKIQMNHAHGNREYRSRVHPIYKKQNPQYGENHPNLIKYKGKNKKKMNPY